MEQTTAKTLVASLLLIPALLFGGVANAQTTGIFVNARAFGLAAGGTTANGAANRAAIQNAINSLGSTGGTVIIPCGFYYVNPGIVLTASQKNITVSGCADAFAYEPSPRSVGNYVGGTVIAWGNAGAIGFDLSQINNAAPAGNYTKLSNMAIVGATGNVASCIKASGMVFLENLAVEGCQNGIWLYEFINSTRVNHVSVTNNRTGNGYGLLVGPGGPSYRDNTIFQVKDSVFRQNTTGVRIEQANNYSFDNVVIESNYGDGLVLFRRHTPGPSVDDKATVTAAHDTNQGGRFTNTWFENNSAGDNAHNQILIDAQTPSISFTDTPSYITFENCSVSSYQIGSSGVWKPAITINSGQHIDFRNCQIGTSDPYNDGPLHAPVHLNANSSYVRFYNTRGNAVFKNAGVYNSTLDSYIPGSFTISLKGCNAATTGTAFYTVNGNLVTLDLPELTCKGDGGTAKALIGIPIALRPGTAKVFVTPMLDNVTWGMGVGSLSAGTITLHKDASGAVWTPGAAFTFKGASMNYTLN